MTTIFFTSPRSNILLILTPAFIVGLLNLINGVKWQNRLGE